MVMICNEISNEKRRLRKPALDYCVCVSRRVHAHREASIQPTLESSKIIENHVEGFGKSTFALRVATAHASATPCQHHAVTLMASVEERNMFLLGAEYF